jgi:hypothetical protein
MVAQDRDKICGQIFYATSYDAILLRDLRKKNNRITTAQTASSALL